MVIFESLVFIGSWEMKIAVLLVTYNRLSCLKKTLDRYSNQTVGPDAIIVVDNASSDETPLFLSEWSTQESLEKRVVLTLSHNSGGSGGFAAGLKFLERSEFDWVLIGDDDAYPEDETVEDLTEAVQRDSNVAAYCTSVVNAGKLDLWHRRHWESDHIMVRDLPCSINEYTASYVDVNVLSFVGALVNLKCAREIGIPDADFFIYYDDTEYSLRLAEVGRIVLLPNIVMHHDTNSKSTNNTTWKSYYYLRNKLITFHRHSGLLPFLWETVLEILKKIGPLSLIIKKRNRSERRLYWSAIKDAWGNNLGEHPLYRPGWVPD